MLREHMRRQRQRLLQVILLCDLAITPVPCSVRSATTSNESPEKRPIPAGVSQDQERWRSENIAGFQVWVASNSVNEETRIMYLLAEAQSFTEQNLRVMFASIAAEFTDPKVLRVTVMSDPAQLERRMTAPIYTVESSNEKRTGLAKRPEPREPREPRDTKKAASYFEARYTRSFDEDEEYFWYTPDAHRGDEIKVTLKSRPPRTYTGNLDWDLLVAAENGDKAKLQILLTRGADANSRNRHGFSALMKAALYGHSAIAQLLLDNGAELNASDENGWTALMCAASNGNPDIVELILSKGAHVNAQDRYGNTALLVTANHTDSKLDTGRTNALKNLRALLEKGADVNAVGYRGETALLRAVRCGDIRMVSVLLEKGADPNMLYVPDLTVLTIARRQGREDIAKLLVKAGARR